MEVIEALSQIENMFEIEMSSKLRRALLKECSSQRSHKEWFKAGHLWIKLVQGWDFVEYYLSRWIVSLRG